MEGESRDSAGIEVRSFRQQASARHVTFAGLPDAQKRSNGEVVQWNSKAAVHPKKLHKWSTRVSKQVKPYRHDATFEDWISGHYNILSFSSTMWERDDVQAVVIFCGGMGGIEKGLERFNKQVKSGDGKYMVPAVVIDADQSSCQTHRLNHPGVPVVTYHCQQWKGTMEMVNKYLDRKYWKSAWVHTSNSCKESSTVNFSRRDVHVGRAQTQWFIRLMQRM